MKMVRLIALCASLGAFSSHAADLGKVSFSREVRAILSDNCFACHGPDEEQRKGKLRLDTREGALAVIDGRAIIKPGDAEGSELIKRIVTADLDDRMPPEKFGKTLSQSQISILKRWINQGADWESHWAFEKPVRPALPEVKNKQWAKNPIDLFVLNKLEQEGLSPSPEAEPEILARRASLDLTGLPPTVEEIDSMLADTSGRAYENVVDRLVDSSRYGEQMARYWLDAARYADSHGYHIDSPRMVWKYREWVINAFNENKPFDQFTVEQIAGDMLPEATVEQKIASGFNRCNMSTGEGGAIEEEYRAKYAADRVETVGTVWLGLTFNCAQCHTHKYDPIAHKEFYQLAAFFNGIDEAALDGNAPAPAPSIKVPSKDQAAEMDRLTREIGGLKEKLDGPNATMDEAQAKWEQEWSEKLKTNFEVATAQSMKASGEATFKTLEDGSVLVEGPNPDKDVYEIVLHRPPGLIGAIRLEAILDPSLPKESAARSDNGNFVLTQFEATAAPLAEPGRRQPVRWATATADFSQDKFPVSNAIDGKGDTGWAGGGHERKENRTAIFIPETPVGYAAGTEVRVRLKFESIFPRHAIGRFRLALAAPSEGLQQITPLKFSPWQMAGPFSAPSGEAAFTTSFPPEQKVDLTQSFEEGKIKWTAKPDFADGKPNNLSGENAATYLYRLVHSPTSRKAAFSFGSDDAIKVWLNGTVVLDRNVQRGVAADQDVITVDLREGANELLVKVVNYSTGYAFYFAPVPEPGDVITPAIAQLLAFNTTRTDQQKATLRRFYRENYSPGWKEMNAQMAQLEDARKKLDATIPVTMVSKEMAKPRDTFILLRGEYDKRSDQVGPNVPAVLPPLTGVEQTNRLALAQWLVRKDHPLTARVTVNRFWQRYFGTGLVKTAEDFGSQGEPPSHPELLDWLAVEFMESGWDVKHIQKLIVTSATYRQSSRLTPEMHQRDPENRLLARGPRFRLDAETLRDNALAVSGLLVDKIGGPSVKPYQPPGLWLEVSYGFREDYEQDKGEGLYRRSMYTYWKRQSPPPGMTTFDAPSREVCTVRRPRTNTPLQALALMNDPQYVEASRAFGQKLMLRSNEDVLSRLRYAYRRATGRSASHQEIEVLHELFQKQLVDFRANPEAAVRFLSVGQLPLDPNLDPAEWAAWTSVGSVILNLDATITKS